VRLGKVQGVERAHHVGAEGLYRHALVVGRAGRAGQLVRAGPPAALPELGVGHVAAHQGKARVRAQMRQVVQPAGGQIVQAQHRFAARQQRLAQVAAHEAGAAGNHGACHGVTSVLRTAVRAPRCRRLRFACRERPGGSSWLRAGAPGWPNAQRTRSRAQSSSGEGPAHVLQGVVMQAAGELGSPPGDS
jgi:hypothetical protein